MEKITVAAILSPITREVALAAIKAGKAGVMSADYKRTSKKGLQELDEILKGAGIKSLPLIESRATKGHGDEIRAYLDKAGKKGLYDALLVKIDEINAILKTVNCPIEVAPFNRSLE